MIRPKIEREPDPTEPPKEPELPPRRVQPRIAPLGELVRTPATLGLVVIAVVVTITSWMHPLTDLLAMQSDVLSDDPWRPLTSTLLHVSPWHLVFNAYWMLALGTPIERENGTLRTAVGYVLVGAASSLAEQALFYGGVGLSGIGYGAFAYGWARAHRETKWAVIVDPVTTRSFVIWFFFCIVTTVTGSLPVANVAHGVGALAGGMLGFARTNPRAWLAFVAIVMVCFVIDLGPVRDHVNFVDAPALDAEQRGIDAINAGDNARAAIELRHAASLAPDEPRIEYNLGVALFRGGDTTAGCEAFARAHQIDPLDDETNRAIEGCNAIE